eukprot:5292535-Pyramimonas_sp.AAC.1
MWTSSGRRRRKAFLIGWAPAGSQIYQTCETVLSTASGKGAQCQCVLQTSGEPCSWSSCTSPATARPAARA